MFPPPKSQAALHDLENIINAKLSQIKEGSGDETAQLRQAGYINWTKKKLIPDPCGDQPGYQRIVSCLVEILMLKNNYHSKTIKGYVKIKNTFSKLRGFPIPVDLSDRNNMCTRLIDAMEVEEVKAMHGNPITNDMFASMKKLAQESPRDSSILVLFDLFCLIRITGFRVVEYAQTTQTKIDDHEYPLGNRLIKAFFPTDWVFRNDKGQLIKIHSLNGNAIVPSEVNITFLLFLHSPFRPFLMVEG